MSTSLANTVSRGTTLEQERTVDNAKVLEQVIIQGDLSKLSPTDRIMYYKAVCDSIGLNPLTKPFDYIQLNGKLTLYAKKDCTEQLRKIHGISLTITSREIVDDIYVVSVRAVEKNGRCDEAIGTVNIAGLKGDAKANALMKAETKAKRRVTLSVCGLGMLDESEDLPNSANSDLVYDNEKSGSNEPIDETELDILVGKIKESESDAAKICEVMNLKDISEIKHKQFIELMRMLERKIAKKNKVDSLPINNVQEEKA